MHLKGFLAQVFFLSVWFGSIFLLPVNLVVAFVTGHYTALQIVIAAYGLYVIYRFVIPLKEPWIPMRGKNLGIL